MSDNNTNDTGEDRTPEEEQGENEDFGSLFESYMTRSTPEVRVGEKLTGEIIVIGQDSVFLNTGSKIDGVAEKSELIDENGEFPYKVGDRLELYVVAKNEDGIQLSKAIGKTSSAELLYDAQKNRIPVEGKVLETCKGGFRVQVMGKTAFCPISQIDVSYVEKPEAYVGETLEFVVERIESKGRNIVVNRRKLLEKLLAEEREKFLAEKSEGDVVEGKVVRIMPYGAFVELRTGVEGMIHISELSWSRVEDPAEVVNIGEILPVKILSISESNAKAGGVKISLSAKQAAADPWEKAPERYESGDKIEGRVTRCASFGAFVEVEPGIEGLVHISEMSHTRRVVKAEDVVRPGDKVTVTVKSIDPANRRMSLSIKDAEGDPWTAFENRIAAGQSMEGRIEKKADFGYFVNLAPGITGLLPKSKIDKAPDPVSIEKLRTDDIISVKIEAIDRSDRKISLAPADTPDRAELQKYTAAEPARGSSSGMGDLGRKLEEALKSKK